MSVGKSQRGIGVGDNNTCRRVLYWYCFDFIQVDGNTLLNKAVKSLAPQNLRNSLSHHKYFIDSHASWDLTL